MSLKTCNQLMHVIPSCPVLETSNCRRYVIKQSSLRRIESERKCNLIKQNYDFEVSFDNLQDWSCDRKSLNSVDVPTEDEASSVIDCQNVQKDEFDVLTKIGRGMLGHVFLLKRKSPFPEQRRLEALKVMRKSDIREKGQISHVFSEKNLLGEIKHPFIIELFKSKSDKEYLYLFMEYVPGGELYRYLGAFGHFDEEVTRFYVAEVVSAISFLHSKTIIFRDLKPDNLMLDMDGHIKLIDFGFAKRVPNSTWTLCGTLQYIAPEMISKRAYTKSVDWWALGVLTFELLTGKPPYDGTSTDVVLGQILQGAIQYPEGIGPTAKNFIQNLLVREPHRRLGHFRNGSSAVKRHKWFSEIVWADVLKKKLKPPIVPSKIKRNESDDEEWHDSQKNARLFSKQWNGCRFDGDSANSDSDDEDSFKGF